MEQQQEKIREAVESFRQDMLDFWKDLINFQAGSKEKDRMQTLMEKVSAYLERQGMESELVESGAAPLIRAWSGKERAGQPILLSGHLDTVFPNGSYPHASTPKEPTYYEIPPEALKDEAFAAMIAEAEKYVGYPYVWGGSSPSTSFDCSGFISWVINHSGWNVGRQTAQGLYNICTPVSPEQAKPGDLVFFVGTYDTAGMSHVGLYVGNNRMYHAGNPIGYADLTGSYWQQHLAGAGRIKQ